MSNETISINEVEREQMEMIYKKEEMGEFFFKKVSIIKKEKKKIHAQNLLQHRKML